MQRVCVTGASGFLGREVVKYLSRIGYSCCGFSHSPESAKSLKDYCALGVYSVDLLESSSCAQLLDRIRPNILIHLAWGTGKAQWQNARIQQAWVEASKRLFSQFVELGGERLFLAGSCYEYCFQSPDLLSSRPLQERLLGETPHTELGKAKLSLAYWVSKSLPEISSVHGKIFYCLGPKQQTDKLIPSILQRLLTNKVIEVGQLTSCRDYLDCRDIAKIITHITFSSATGACNIGRGFGYTIEQLIASMASTVGVEAKVKENSELVRAQEPFSIIADCSILHSALKGNTVQCTPRSLAASLSDLVSQKTFDVSKNCLTRC